MQASTGGARACLCCKAAYLVVLAVPAFINRRNTEHLPLYISRILPGEYPTMSKETVLNIIVSPRSSRSEIVIDKTGNIKLYLNSPPVDGRANAECVGLFSKSLGIAKSRIKIEKGEKGKRKRIIIQGMFKQEVLDKLKGKAG